MLREIVERRKCFKKEEFFDLLEMENRRCAWCAATVLCYLTAGYPVSTVAGEFVLLEPAIEGGKHDQG